MIYIIWSGYEGTQGSPEDFYFTTKKQAVDYLRKHEGMKLKKQGYGDPLWEKFDIPHGKTLWADIIQLSEYTECDVDAWMKDKTNAV